MNTRTTETPSPSAVAHLTLPGSSSPATDPDDVAPHGLRVPRIDIPARDVDVDLDLAALLVRSARTAAERAYAPYSRFNVGAALVMADDPQRRVYTGANVENASSSVGVCAERTALASAAAAGFRQLHMLAVSCVDALDAPLAARSPCGVCRQMLREFTGDAGALVLIDTSTPGVLCDVLDVERLLPFAFKLDVSA